MRSDKLVLSESILRQLLTLLEQQNDKDDKAIVETFNQLVNQETKMTQPIRC